MRGKLSRKQAASDIEMQDFVQLFCFWKSAKYCLDPEPEPEPEPEPQPEPKLFKVGTGPGTTTYHYGSTTLPEALPSISREPMIRCNDK
jgi:hypothetical protein